MNNKFRQGKVLGAIAHVDVPGVASHRTLYLYSGKPTKQFEPGSLLDANAVLELVKNNSHSQQDIQELKQSINTISHQIQKLEDDAENMIQSFSDRIDGIDQSLQTISEDVNDSILNINSIEKRVIDLEKTSCNVVDVDLSGFYIFDEDGFIGFYVDETGAHSKNIG